MDKKISIQGAVVVCFILRKVSITEYTPDKVFRAPHIPCISGSAFMLERTHKHRDNIMFDSASRISLTF